MSLTVGARLGPYEVTAPLGAGGMGEVYRARDTKLNRDVALKVLPAPFAADPERLARLMREAQLLASLNHPNIASIHGLEDAGDTRALVLELVEGPTLADRIAQGPLPLDEALAIARQILDALEAAHEHGIVHRDLKPANIKVRSDGMVKVLDFGLAKALEPAEAGSVAATMSPTLSIHATQAGLILGTAAYMSPEQAAGKPADKRSDIWAFGVLLLEMLTGGQAFTGESVPHVLASVLKSDPDWSRLPSDTPAQVRRLLRRCLEKDRKRRLDSAVAARLEIDDTLSMPESGRANEPVAARSRVTPIAIAAIVGGALVAAVTWALLRPPSSTPRQASRFLLASADPLAINQFDRSIALSPDGRYIVYVTPIKGAGTGGGLSVRSLDRLEPVPGAGDHWCPVAVRVSRQPVDRLFRRHRAQEAADGRRRTDLALHVFGCASRRQLGRRRHDRVRNRRSIDGAVACPGNWWAADRVDDAACLEGRRGSLVPFGAAGGPWSSVHDCPFRSGRYGRKSLSMTRGRRNTGR